MKQELHAQRTAERAKQGKLKSRLGAEKEQQSAGRGRAESEAGCVFTRAKPPDKGCADRWTQAAGMQMWGCGWQVRQRSRAGTAEPTRAYKRLRTPHLLTVAAHSCRRALRGCGDRRGRSLEREIEGKQNGRTNDVSGALAWSATSLGGAASNACACFLFSTDPWSSAACFRRCRGRRRG